MNIHNMGSSDCDLKEVQLQEKDNDLVLVRFVISQSFIIVGLLINNLDGFCVQVGL